MNLMNKAILMERYKQAMPVFDTLIKEGTPFVIHKGPVLSQLAYGDSYRRHSSDIDLLLPRGYMDLVKAVLIENGFAQKKLTDKGIVPMTRQEQIFHLNNTHQSAPFYKESANRICPHVCIDINLDIFWGEMCGNTDMIGFLSDRCGMMLFEDTNVPVLPCEKAFLATCLHHYKDMNSIYLLYTRNGYPLSHLKDIAGFLQTTPMDIEKLVALIDQYDAGPYVYFCLDAVRHGYSGTFSHELMDILYQPGFEENYFHFGLKKEERKLWQVDPIKLIRKGNVRKALDERLSEKEKKKIYLNRMFME